MLNMFNPVLRVLRFWRSWISVIAPVVLTAIPLTADPENEKAMWCAYNILVCAVYWICECTPLAITSLLPVVLLPLTGVASTNAVCINYLKGTNMMFLAGLVMAIAVEHCGLHVRIALNIIQGVGTSKRMLMLGFMICAMFLSMWISNTAATAMMVPIVDAIDKAINSDQNGNETDEHKDIETTVKKPRDSKSRNFLLLACAYASNIGGTGVITGSPPNLVVLSTLNKEFGTGKAPLSYATWMAFNVPLMLVNTLAAWCLLIAMEAYATRGSPKPTREGELKVKNILAGKKRELGKMSLHEIQVLILFILLVILWFFQDPVFITGWASFFTKATVGSATPAVLIVWMLFLLPKNVSSTQPSEALLDWHTVEKRLPWGVILLLGGGFALADATASSGLSNYLASKLISLQYLETWQINLIISCATTFVTEMSLSLCQNPIYLMMTAAVCCSYAFMLPVATAPNAIVFSHSTMKTSDMMKAGFLLNIICIITTNFAINTWGVPLFGLSEFPAWAGPSAPSCNITSGLDLSTTIPGAL
ncbi:solute carrier family 13 member 2 [Eurytemora carolleeae]|uniref:solute carrier family 13 member 2 n=1 Tax=Eurytemora carolleeae TaxID=1294199 RepID=UPI000C759724|nr:solute carrier family 13 member 2 [Eurytemora carolleeae]|eukprot:XP_023332563.1 solute carrier family 13 member 2-like [Eurytemora affinis]